jgi:hypothetical protein
MDKSAIGEGLQSFTGFTPAERQDGIAYPRLALALDCLDRLNGDSSGHQ